MAFKFFVVPVREPEGVEDSLNAFLRAHKVLAVNRRWVEQGNDSYWSLCTDYLESAQGKGPKSNDAGGQRAKIDYKAILSPEDFAVFAQLRDLRKEVAQAEAVPVYTIFTNEQLAQIVQKKARTRPIWSRSRAWATPGSQSTANDSCRS